MIQHDSTTCPIVDESSPNTGQFGRAIRPIVFRIQKYPHMNDYHRWCHTYSLNIINNTTTNKTTTHNLIIMNNIKKKTNNKSTTTHKPQVDLIEIQICEYNRPTGLKKLSSAPCLNSMFIIWDRHLKWGQKRPTIIESVFTQVINQSDAILHMVLLQESKGPQTVLFGMVPAFCQATCGRPTWVHISSKPVRGMRRTRWIGDFGSSLRKLSQECFDKAVKPQGANYKLTVRCGKLTNCRWIS